MALSPQTKSIVSLLLLFLLLTIHNAESKPSNFIRTKKVTPTHMKQKLSHLHFYFHDIVSGQNATAIPITKPAKPLPSSSSSFSVFGMITMIDDLLTEGPDRSSPCVGRAQGLYAGAAQQEIGFLQAMNLYFTAGGKYNGSVLTVLGRNAPMNPMREMPVIGGSGLFRFARGYALARTHWLDMKTGDAVVEYNVTVMHY